MFAVKPKIMNLLDKPEPRKNFSLFHVSGGVMILAGGEDTEGNQLKDMWHLRVDLNSKTVEFSQVPNLLHSSALSKAGAVLVNWPEREFPVMLGPSGSKIQSDDIEIAEIKDLRCTSESDSLACLPCPEGSVLNLGVCQACNQTSFWMLDRQNVMLSKCQKCPEGHERNEFQQYGCSPCKAGTFFAKDRCEACSQNSFCPLGSAVAFPYT